MLHHISHREKIIVMLAVMSALFLVALDQTIIATALGKIVEEFQSFSSLSWVVTAYMLTTTVTVPLAGKLSDMFGRRRILLSGVAIFVLGSLFSGAAHSISQLIAARAVQGLGGGVIMANAFTIIGDLFTPRERGKWQGIIGAVFGLSSVVGPLLGGFLTDEHKILSLTTGWRWTFLVNVPIGIISFAIIARFMPVIKHKHKPTIDYAGAGLLTLALSSLILAVDNTDKIFASVIDNGISVGLIKTILYSVSAASTLLFIIAERKAVEPIIPLGFFRNKTFQRITAAAFLFGAAFLGAILYLTQFNQQVFGANASKAGLMLLPMVFGLSMTAAAVGQLVSRTGHYKKPLVFGFAIASLAILALTSLKPDSPYWHEAVIMFFVGMGLGAGMPILNLAIQNEFEAKDLGVSTSSLQLFRGLGSTIGTAIFGTLLISGITTSLGQLNNDPYIQTLKSQPQISQQLKNVDADTALNLNTVDMKRRVNMGLEQATTHMPTGAAEAITAKVHSQQNNFSQKVISAFANGLKNVFMIASVLMMAATLIVLGIQEKPLRDKITPTHE